MQYTFMGLEVRDNSHLFECRISIEKGKEKSKEGGVTGKEQRAKSRKRRGSGRGRCGRSGQQAKNGVFLTESETHQ
jgi:hypothetical protein